MSKVIAVGNNKGGVAKKEEYLRVRREAWREKNKARKEEQLLMAE